jgi:hypothetical protein
MEEIVAVKVRDSRGRKHYFLTWGRVFDPVDPKPLISVIRGHLHTFGIGKSLSIDVCDSLQEAVNERYFYEAFFEMTQVIGLGRARQKWKAAIKRRIRHGKEIYYLGRQRS